MNHDHETPPKDPKKSTKEVSRELMYLAEQHEKQKAAQSESAWVTLPDETPPQGDDMPTEWTIETLAAEVLRRGELSDSRMETVTAHLREHGAQISEINAWRAGVLTPEELSALFAKTVDEQTRKHYEGIDAEYTRISTLIDDISGKYGNAAFAMEKVNAMQGQITNLTELFRRRGEQIEASTKATDHMVDTFASGYIALLGIDPRKPDHPRLKTSVIDDITLLRDEIKATKERADLAEKMVDDQRVILAGFTGQFMGETGLFSEIHEIRDYFQKKRLREELVSDVLSDIKGLLKVPAFQAVAGAITGTGVVALFIKFIEVVSGVLF